MSVLLAGVKNIKSVVKRRNWELGLMETKTDPASYALLRFRKFYFLPHALHSSNTLEKLVKEIIYKF